MALVNPFDVTKAVDFTDEEIASTWVDLPDGGFTALASPASPMALFIVGGKGGGRTHLLRYYSYSLQRLRHHGNVLHGIQQEKYLGIYFRCTGLNSSRFHGKGMDDEAWSGVFAYYTDVWLAQLVVEALVDLLRLHDEPDPSPAETAFAQRVAGLFDTRLDQTNIRGAIDLLGALRDLQRALDVSINNAALRRDLSVDVATSPGRLVFGVPEAAVNAFDELRGVRIAYLVDEFENLTIDQQRYMNTLIRERELPSTFLIGSRMWGVRTHETLSAGETNRQGSEFDQLILEEAYRDHRYERFCSDIVKRRLAEVGVAASQQAKLSAFFEASESHHDRARRLVGDLPWTERPWFVRLINQLSEVGVAGPVRRQVAEELSIPTDPLLEKFAVFLFYRGWAAGRDFEEASGRAMSEAAEASEDGTKRSKARTTLNHYREDLYAQLLRDMGSPVEYFGFETFVRMSGYLPRNLLIVLKQITRWAHFLDEEPFRGGVISLKAQRNGVEDASAWFLADAPGLGRLGAHTQGAIRRLGSYLDAQRYSDKPVEPSCCAFETDGQGLSDRAEECLRSAVAHSLLLDVPTGRRDRNTQVRHSKYQLNPMLAPQFDLPVSMRGVARLSAVEVNAIFDYEVTEAEFGSVRRQRMRGLNAPFQGSGPVGKSVPDQPRLDL